jgi:hypothetical protein
VWSGWAGWAENDRCKANSSGQSDSNSDQRSADHGKLRLLARVARRL